MKRTVFYDIHKQLGAKLIEFGGFEMPVQYTSIIEEHKCVRNTVGVFDVSHMGEFFIKGPDALALVQKVTTNDASKLTSGKAQYSAMCYPDGGIVDDLLVYRDDKHFMLVVNASNIKKDFEWIQSNIGSLNVEVIDASDETALLAVQGPKSLETLQKLTKVILSEIPYYSFVHGQIAEIDCVISRTGYTGEIGFELYFKATSGNAEKMWNAIFEAGKTFGIKPIGLGARDTLRLEMGFCLYGNDIDQTTNPLEAGLGWITKFDKGDFIAKDVLLKVKQEGVKRKLVGLSLLEKAIPRHGYEIRSNGNSVGTVTSGMMSPILEKGVGMGYISTHYAAVGTTVDIGIREKSVKAEIVKVPFIKR